LRYDDYAYAVGNIRANEYKRLTGAELRQLLTLSSADDITRELGVRGISLEREQALNYIRKLSEENAVFDVFLMRNDFHNMKTAIKGRVSNQDISALLMYPSMVSIETIQNCVAIGDFSILPIWIREAAEQAFHIVAKTNDGQQCDIILDTSYFRVMQDYAKKSKNVFIIELTEKMVVFFNLKAVLRAFLSKKTVDFIQTILVVCSTFDINKLAHAATNKENLGLFLASHGFNEAVRALDEYEAMAAFEIYCDNEILHFVDTVKYEPFGIEPLIGYLIYQEMQQKNIQILLAGKRANLPDDKLLERMRWTYA